MFQQGLDGLKDIYFIVDRKPGVGKCPNVSHHITIGDISSPTDFCFGDVFHKSPQKWRDINPFFLLSKAEVRKLENSAIAKRCNLRNSPKIHPTGKSPQAQSTCVRYGESTLGYATAAG